MHVATVENRVDRHLNMFPGKELVARYGEAGMERTLLAANELILAILIPLMPRENFAAVFDSVMNSAQGQDDRGSRDQLQLLLQRSANETNPDFEFVADRVSESEAQEMVPNSNVLVVQLVIASEPRVISMITSKLRLENLEANPTVGLASMVIEWAAEVAASTIDGAGE